MTTNALTEKLAKHVAEKTSTDPAERYGYTRRWLAQILSGETTIEEALKQLEQ